MLRSSLSFQWLVMFGCMLFSMKYEGGVNQILFVKCCGGVDVPVTATLPPHVLTWADASHHSTPSVDFPTNMLCNRWEWGNQVPRAGIHGKLDYFSVGVIKIGPISGVLRLPFSCVSVVQRMAHLHKVLLNIQCFKLDHATFLVFYYQHQVSTSWIITAFLFSIREKGRPQYRLPTLLSEVFWPGQQQGTYNYRRCMLSNPH